MDSLAASSTRSLPIPKSKTGVYTNVSSRFVSDNTGNLFVLEVLFDGVLDYHTAMEILGIIWAASIIHPAASAATATDDIVEHQLKQQGSISLESTAAWFNSLSDAYGWRMSSLDAYAAYGSYAALTRLLVPGFNTLSVDSDSLSAVAEPQPDPDGFTALVPTIGVGLSSFEAPLEASPETADIAFEDVAVQADWHGWNAVASVRLETPEPATSPQTLALASDGFCLSMQAPYQTSDMAMTAAPKTQVWVHNHFVGDVMGHAAAQKMATKLRTLIKEDKLEPAQLNPLIGTNFVGVSHQNELLFVVDETLRSHPEIPATAMAVQWVNNLRQAFDEKPLGLATIQMAAAGLAETSESFYGTASWYGPGFHGRKTANGEIFDENALTAAHKTLPFNTHLKVINRLNGKSVVVRINDRGPYVGQRSLDLSKAAAHCLGSTSSGVVPYEAVVLTPDQRLELDDLSTAQLSGETPVSTD